MTETEIKKIIKAVLFDAPRMPNIPGGESRLLNVMAALEVAFPEYDWHALALDWADEQPEILAQGGSQRFLADNKDRQEWQLAAKRRLKNN